MFVRAGGAGGSGRVGALRAGERVVLENDTLNVAAVVVVVDEQTGRERTLSHSARTDRQGTARRG